MPRRRNSPSTSTVSRGPQPAERPADRPGAYSRLRELAPDLVSAYEALSRHAAAAGPLDAGTLATVKLALSVGRGSWRAVHAHARKALEAGVDPAVLRQVAIAAVPVLGLHAALDAVRWIDEVIAERS